jgi:hypothetical protein
VKRCRKCMEEKPLSEFYNRAAKCKPCTRDSVKANRLAKIDYYRQYDRMRASMPHRLQKTIEITRRWRKANPERWRAQIELNKAIKEKRVAALPCLVCGDKAEAHHTHYDAPLEVVWLCPAHHKQAHAMARKAA